jgi:endonuclease/exonuclease/phosphatase (EEP) superfamily protein YafD
MMNCSLFFVENNMIRAAILLTLLAVTVSCRSVRQPETPTAPHFTVLTYNVNWGGPRPDLAAHAILSSNADIVCLQETTPEWEAFLRPRLRGQYPFMHFRHPSERAGGGCAFISKRRSTEVAYIPSNSGWFDAWIRFFDTPAGPVQVLNVHLRPPVSDSGSFASGYFVTGDDRLQEMERFAAGLRPNVPAIVAGDFNDHENSPVMDWLRSKDYLNALPQFDRRTPTWRWRYGLVSFRRRMDHIVYSPELHCYNAAVLPAGASDHVPVIAVLGKNLQ